MNHQTQLLILKITVTATCFIVRQTIFRLHTSLQRKKKCARYFIILIEIFFQQGLYAMFVIITFSKTGNVSRMLHSGTFVQLLLPWKIIIITYSERVFVGLVIRHSKRVSRAKLSVASPAVQNLYTLPHNRSDFWEKSFGT